eukprot:gnl/TRDRNA2_/TRDRNA2_163766_c0_seq7.p1 gnl/TRDRNA2_/TRDRNA2_163766_c0~~gnl/TRDRNA2_/TRDRNA2_163766_c0_seq7.p1  ORF type:complete len:266 (-),score=-1.73 gnl/TRDRNA2_/TRDRNA2_163766_c0_seq7:459-1256(-)
MPSTDFYAQSLCSSHHHGNTVTKTSGHPLDQQSPLRPELTLPHSPALSSSSRSSRSSRSASRPLSTSSGRQLIGPEHFFYDKSSYTGVHSQGGPTVKDADSFVCVLRPGQHSGSCFTRTGGHPLDSDHVRDRGLGAGSDAHNFEDSLRPGMHCGSTFIHTAGHSLDHNDATHVDSRICSSSRTKPSPRERSHSSARSGPGGGDLAHSLRPGHHLGSTFIRVHGHPLDHDMPRDTLSTACSGTSKPSERRRRPLVGTARELRGPEH